MLVNNIFVQIKHLLFCRLCSNDISTAEMLNCMRGILLTSKKKDERRNYHGDWPISIFMLISVTESGNEHTHSLVLWINIKMQHAYGSFEIWRFSSYK